jgi:cytoskeletal protein CcmA (bactofilin family)
MNFETVANPSTWHETTVNIVAEGTRIEGQVVFDHITRVHGVLVGEVRSREGSTLVLSETAVVEGNIEADTLVIDGYVHGNVIAKTRAIISRTGRVVGNIKAPSIVLEFGSYFEGRCTMEENSPISDLTPKPA